MNEKLALIVNADGSFSVSEIDGQGNQQQVAWGHDLTLCLKQAAQILGHPLVLPIFGPNTSF